MSEYVSRDSNVSVPKLRGTDTSGTHDVLLSNVFFYSRSEFRVAFRSAISYSRSERSELVERVLCSESAFKNLVYGWAKGSQCHFLT